MSILDEIMRRRRLNLALYRATAKAKLGDLEAAARAAETPKARAAREFAAEVYSKTSAGALTAVEIEHHYIENERKKLIADAARQEPDEIDEDPMPPGCEHCLGLSDPPRHLVKGHRVYAVHTDYRRAVAKAWRIFHGWED